MYKHKFAYILLTFILAIHVGLFFIIWPSKVGQRMVALSLATSYLCWGIFAHVKANHITRQIVREYLFAAILAGGMLFFLTM